MSDNRTRANVAHMRRILTITGNPILATFARVWDGSLDHLQRERAQIDGWAVESSLRDAADDFLYDLEQALRADT